MSRTVRESVFDARCVGCPAKVRVAVVAGKGAEDRAAAKVVEAHGWEAREHGEGLLLVCPDCIQNNAEIGYCEVFNHDWQPISADGKASVLGCTRCRTKPPHKPLADPDAAKLPSQLPDTDWNAFWSPAAGGGIDHLDLVEHRLRDVDDGAVLAASGGPR